MSAAKHKPDRAFAIRTVNVEVNGRTYGVIFDGNEPRAVYRTGINTKAKNGRRGIVNGSRSLPIWGPAARAAIAKATGGTS